jgi:hypothetical protein
VYRRGISRPSNVYVYYILGFMRMFEEKVNSGNYKSNSGGDRVVILTFYMTYFEQVRMMYPSNTRAQKPK